MKRHIASACLVLAALPAASVPARADSNCKSNAAGVAITDLPESANAGTGLVARPESPPTALVVFAHGYTHEAQSWKQHMRDAAAHGALVVTPDYRYGTPNRGWHVGAGARDVVNAAQYYLDLCKDTIRSVIVFGVSMGGNTSGLAVASQAKRPSGAPLFDYWFNIEGATNVIETYHEATLVAPASAYAANAKQDIEAEMGGTFAEVPEEYIERTVVARIEDIAASGVKGVVMVHGVDDGSVPYNQSREMTAGLRLMQIPTEMTTVVLRGEAESGTTITGNALGNSSPFAGHGSEGSSTQRVIRVAHDRLHALLAAIAAGNADAAAPKDAELVADVEDAQ